MLAEAQARLNLVSRLAAPISANELYVALQPLLILHGPPDFGQDEEAAALSRAWLGIYEKALCAHPREAIDIAVSECIRLNKYNKFPLPGYLNELAESTSNEIRMIAFRLRRAVERAAQNRPAPKKTPEDAQAIQAMVQEMRGADGKIKVVKSTADVMPASDRNATAEALRRLADYQ